MNDREVNISGGEAAKIVLRWERRHGKITSGAEAAAIVARTERRRAIRLAKMERP